MAELTPDRHVPSSGPDRAAMYRSDATWTAAVWIVIRPMTHCPRKLCIRRILRLSLSVDLCPRFLTHIPSQESLIRTGTETTGIQLTQIWFACAVAEVQLKRLCCEDIALKSCIAHIIRKLHVVTNARRSVKGSSCSVVPSLE